ncbi:MIF4G-domain-containing protein [Tothia fuscella]|uniref:Pre-mRNA-splicing factor CWC22 n=1 Tax=Tothia fuscella TaxID=1048955 RepID=A0A9P4P161_9PEZI|nr:MIF4G-domain-containing protein [Tothia fuscella]
MQVASAIRLPTPEPMLPASVGKRKRSPSSRSPSPRRQPSPPRRRSYSPSPVRQSYRDAPPAPVPSGPLPRDVDRQRALERQRQLEMRQREEKPDIKPVTEEQKQAAAKKEYDELLNKRSGGVYIPPARLRALQAQITDKNSKEFQRMAWEALKKSINGLINKVNVSNIKFIVPELFGENLVRGRGLFCRSIMKAQSASLPFSAIFAASAAIVNTKLPQVGELLAKRLVVQFRKAFKRNDKTVCISSTTFLAHLCNQQVIHEMLIAQILLLLLHQPTDDSVEIAVNLCKECGQHLEEFNSAIAIAVFDQFRSILHESTDLEKRTQYMIEVLFQVRRDKYKDYPAIKEELDLVEEEDQITHKVDLDGEIEVQDGLNIFKFDADYEANEEAYKKLKAEILGEADGSDEDDEDASDDDSSEDEEAQKERALEIKDQTNTDLVNLRRSIYLTIKSSGLFEEAVHKLMKINLPAGQEPELPSMIIECCSQERTFEKFYGSIGERFCKLNRLWTQLFEEQFVKYYETIHRYETNRLRIIAQFFGHLLSTDAIGWHVLSVIHLNEEETTSSSRIFIKILFEEIAQAMGMQTFASKLREDTLQPSLDGIFSKDDPKKTRFSINFFTAIQMGPLTEDMREYLKNMPKPAPPPLPEADSESDSDTASSYSSYRSRSRSRSVSRSRSRSRTPPRRSTARGGRDRSPSASRSRSRSRSPAPRRRSRSPVRSTRGREASYSRSPSRSRSPPRRNGVDRSRRYSTSPSRSPSPPPRRRARSGSSRRSVNRTPPRRVRPRSISSARAPRNGVGGEPSRRRRNSSSVDERRGESPPPRRRRYSSDSRSPPPRRGNGIPTRERSRSPPRRS